MSLIISIDSKKLDERVSEGVIKVHGEVFVYFPASPEYAGIRREDYGNQKYTVFLGGDQQKIPLEAIKLHYEVGGAQGDTRLRFKNGNIIFMPLSDYEQFLKNKPDFVAQAQIIYDAIAKFVKGDEQQLADIGVQIARQ